MSAPASSASLRELKETEPSWLNPCGESQEVPNVPSDHGDAADAGAASNPLTTLQLQTNLVSGEVANFLDAFSKEVFHGNFEIENEFRDKKYPWLPELPQMDDHDLPADHFDGLEVGEALRKAFTNMQRFAVGLEQIAWDRKNSGDALAPKFHEAQRRLCSVLCELVTAMERLSVELPPSVSRDIMEDAVRLEPGDARDWIIFRDYLNGLKYTEAVIKHFASP